MISFWELLVAVAVLAGGWAVLRAAIPALALLVLIIPPPMNLDGRLVSALQGATSKVGSRVLDYCGVLHYLDGNTVEVGAKSYFVDKACSGINSLFSTLAVTLFYLLWTRAHWLRGALLVLAAVFWVVVANVVRVSLIVLIDSKLGIDLSKDGWDPPNGMFYQHTILGFVLFGLVLALVASTDRFLMFLGTAVRWGGDAATAGAEELTLAVAEPRPWSVGWGAVAPALLGYGLLVLFQFGEMQLGAIVTETALVKSYNDWKAEDLPEQISGWARQPESTFESRDRDNPFGAHSRTWRYQNKSGMTAVVSFDYPFPEWHDLRLCYKAIGWGLNESDRVTQQVRDPGAAGAAELDGIRFELSKPFELRGYGWFTEFDQTGKPLMIPSGMVGEYTDPRTYATLRWDERFPAIRDRWLSLFGKAKAPPNFMDILQVQVLVEHYGPLPAAAKEEAEKFFFQAANLIRAKCAAGATGGAQ
jgi:exosortase